MQRRSGWVKRYCGRSSPDAANHDESVLRAADMLPRGKKGVTVADRFLKTDLGLLVAIGMSSSDESDDEDVGDEGGDDEQEAERDTTTVAISPETQYLGVRAILFDPQANDPATFKPVVVAGVLGSIIKDPVGRKKNTAGKTAETSFQIRRAAVKRLVKQLPANPQAGLNLSVPVRGGVLNATLVGVHVTPLAEITTEDKVAEYVDQLVAMVES